MGATWPRSVTSLQKDIDELKGDQESGQRMSRVFKDMSYGDITWLGLSEGRGSEDEGTRTVTSFHFNLFSTPA